MKLVFIKNKNFSLDILLSITRINKRYDFEGKKKTLKALMSLGKYSMMKIQDASFTLSCVKNVI